ncbi:putative F-box domain, FBD domain, leucine-rich repeat domain, L domain-containing protein [Medicago truncatula]|uniref:F-box/FBD/LRR protein n=1 Tax=Medicago truncatula TaxID=3880 RepID=G7JDU3_MEDTR|nr:F-box/FBD/LRR protein [Medicago truncatula]RHN61891.1 putative F-box domain, FBD domain, leucine-rich repeat domain, L domain-containing protein [Medicago truncatula]
MSQRLRMDDDYTPINDLPDTYLHQILSFVSIKDVAIITMLSKRWYSVFLSQPILNLDDSHFRDPSTVRKFFESMIAARDNYHPPIRIPLSHSTSNVTTKFVSAALNRGLQISLLCVTILRDPDVDLPLLKVLHLESVTFGRPVYLSKILLACPIIHDLVTKDLALTRLIRTLSGSRPIDTSLSKLVRANISGLHIYFDQLHNVEHLRLHMTWRYNISAIFHNLTYLDLTFDLPPLLRETRKAKWIWLLNLLYKFPKLQTLIIDEVDTYNNDVAGEWEDREKQIVPDCLLYHLTTCSLRSIRSINCELQFAKYIMQNSGVLTTMKIQFAKSAETASKHQMFNELSSLCPARKCQLLFINLNDN